MPKSINDTRDLDIIEILHTALMKTVSIDGPFTLEQASSVMSSLRAHRELVSGNLVNVIFETPTDVFQKMFNPIKIPVRKGILGYRVLLIRKHDQHIFSNIESISELTKFKAGQGLGWTDVEILKNNGINVITSASYDGLFSMLIQGRFDFFPRGINEIGYEYSQFKGDLPELWVDDSLLLYYPFPKYFFVSKTNPQLADRIERGLNIMINDGSFDEIFYKHHRYIIDELNLSKRKIIRLENDLLPSDTPLGNHKLWFNPINE